MERLNEKQLESRINAFLERKTDQLDIEENPLDTIAPSKRWHFKRHQVLPSFIRDQFAH